MSEQETGKRLYKETHEKLASDNLEIMRPEHSDGRRAL
jgi:hypothetical protein